MPLKRGLSLRHRNAVKFNARCKQRSISRTEEDKENVKPRNLLDSTVSSIEEEKEEEEEQPKTQDDIYHKFLALLLHDEIKGLLVYDRCRVFTHRWALASVAVYFHRLDKFIDTLLLAKFDFYVLLHLANEMLSDFEYHWVIRPYAKQFHTFTYDEFCQRKTELWKGMNFRAHITIEHLEQVMNNHQPEHFAWGRQCEPSHDMTRRTPSLQPFVSDMANLPNSCLLCQVIEHEEQTRRRRANEAIGLFIDTLNSLESGIGTNDEGLLLNLLNSSSDEEEQ